MAVEGATQALVAAFFFGIVLNAASAALVLYLRGHGLAAVFRDSQRLVLVLFLFSAALWAQIDFVTILLDITSSPTPCQVGVIFSTVFDQLARFSIEQFLLWALNDNDGAKLSFMQLVPQLLVLARFAAGAVFTGFTRPQTDSFCVATTSALPVGIAVAALDGVVILLLLIKAFSARGAAKQSNGAAADRARALMSVVLGLGFWMGTSVPLLLGIRTLALATRTALPAGGLLVLIVSVAGSAGALSAPRATGSRPPEAPSPRRINISRDISTADTDYPPTRFEDLKEAALRSSTTFVNPREAPRVKDETSIGNAFGTGFAPLMPPLPMSTAPAPDMARKLDRLVSQKKNPFSLASGKISIGHPILQENSGQNPLSKIAVMDLQAAAVADRERRARQEEGNATNAPRPSTGMAPEEILKRSVSVKRKEVASVSTTGSGVSATLHPEDASVGLTTSARLSPGGEDARRRSPRQSFQEEPVQPRQASPVQAAESVAAQAVPLQNRPLTVQQPLLKTNIRPSRMLPPSPKTTAPEPTKTPLQRRPTIGLPSNPRAKGLEVSNVSGSQHRTILFVNNIQYNDPLVVDAIVKTAGNPAVKAAPVTGTPGRSASVVHRPRPIPRKPAESPAQASPALYHRRSKSGGSLIGRKSLLTSSAGSPTQLPPLPSLPKTAGLPARPQPNDTKSMTFEEKVTLLFPSPPSGNAVRRRSSVPEVPRIPVSYLDMDSSPGESNRTTKTSFHTESVLEVDEIPRLPGKLTVNVSNEAGSSWFGAFDNKQASGQRKSSPVIPEAPVRVSAWTETTYEDDTTNWSALDSPEIAVSVPFMPRLAPASIQMPPRQAAKESQPPSDNSAAETLPIILETPVAQQTTARQPVAPQPPIVATPEMPTWHRRVGDECPTFSARKEKTRARKTPAPAPLPLHTVSTRKILAIQPEPSPLESPEQAIRQIQAQLKNLDELEQAIPESASRRLALLEDLEREMGQQAEHWLEIKHDMGRDSMSSMQTTSPAGRNSRHASVASTLNLPTESVRQSIGADRRGSRLARMRNDANLAIPDASNRNSSSPQLSKWQKRLTEAQMDYMDAQLLRSSNVNFMQLARAQLASPTPPDSDHSEAGLSPVPSLPNVLVVAQPPVQQKAVSLWTPPSKESAATTSLLWAPAPKQSPQVEAALPGLSVRPAQRKELAPLTIQSSELWRKPYNTASGSASGLWRPRWASAAPPAQPIARTPSNSRSTPQKAPRPVTQRPPRRNKRVTLLPDILESPEPLPNKRGTLGIFQFPWGEKSDTASIQQRTSMYMAMPGTMTTGGPSVGPAAAADARARQLESAGYSSSFFDAYDDEDGLEMDSDENDSDDDDDFDETTLWEIASLLKTDDVPSRNSLLGRSVVDDYMDELDSADESEEEQDGEESHGESIVIALADPRELLLAAKTATAPQPPARIGLPMNPKASLNRQAGRAASPTAPEAAPASEMSRTPTQSAEVQIAETAQGQGSTGLWNPPSQADVPRGALFIAPRAGQSVVRGSSEEPAAKYMTRKPRPAEQKPLERLTTTKLWESVGAKKSERNWLLDGRAQQQELVGLWNPPSQADTILPRGGLFVLVQTGHSVNRGSSEEPAAKHMARRLRPAEQKPLARLTSTKLWASGGSVKGERNWILGDKALAQGSAGLWNPPSPVDKFTPRGGLFAPEASRSASRGSSEEPAAKYMTRRPRPAEVKQLERLASTTLWQAAITARSERNWILGAKEQKKASPGLWNLPSQTSEPTLQGGLFVPTASRFGSRGSSEEPAAKYMSRRPRAAEQKPLERLTSAKLWKSRDAARESGRNWILGAKTEQKKASASLWNLPSQANEPAPRGGLFVLTSSRSENRGSSEEPAAKYMTRKPRATEQRPLEQLTSSKLWESRGAAQESERNWILGATVKQGVKAQRPRAASSVWEAALQEATALSARAPTFDSAAKHPVFAANSLITRSEWFHPAAIGYTYDVANVHPVFFGSLAITCTEDAVHPAISAYASKKLRRQRSKHRSADSRSRSHSRSSRRKDEIRAQIHALEQQQAERPPVPSSLGSDSAIQAQIEALEQERLFVERAAREKYHQRTASMASAAVAEPADAMMPAAIETVQDLQRHLSRQIRQSLVFSSAAAAEALKPENNTVSIPTRGQVSFSTLTSAPSQAAIQNQNNNNNKTELLWTPPTTLTTAPPASANPGLWSHAAPAPTSPCGARAEEDATAAAQRARGRKVMQKRQRRQEILAQIAAVERGANPFVDFGGMGLWRAGNSMGMGMRRDWLHSV